MHTAGAYGRQKNVRKREKKMREKKRKE